jgi:hypothetical protein
MCAIEIVDISSDATEWYFRFDNSSPGSRGAASCDVELRLNEPYGSEPVNARLTGSFSALIEPNGDLYLADFDAELSSFEVLLQDSAGNTYPYDVGRLSLALDRCPPDPDPGSRLPRANAGYIDLETGSTQLTWSVYADSPQLRAIEWNPMGLTVSESGHLDPHTLSWRCNGVGVVTSGELETTAMKIINAMGPTPKLTMEVPPTVPSEGTVPINLKYRVTQPLGSAPPDEPETFELSGWVARTSGSGDIILGSYSVSILGGSDEVVGLTTNGLAPGSRVQIWAYGAGESCVGSTVVCE